MNKLEIKKIHEIAEFWSSVLNIKTKKVEILFVSIKPATRKDLLGYFQLIKNGEYINPEKDIEYDTIQIYLRNFDEIEVPKVIENLVYQGIVLHELMHIKCPDRSEDEIIEITGQYLSGAHSFKTRCVFCDEILPTLTELKKHLENVHGAKEIGDLAGRHHGEVAVPRK